MSFNYEEAFSRNLGWVTKSEQMTIKESRIAIIGMGGVGGHHLHALARIGFQNFKIADLDTFEVQNFNRQFGATLSSIGEEKVDTLKRIVLDINPEANIEVYPSGIQLENMDTFLSDVDVICDGLDLYASHLRAPLYEKAHKNGIYVISAGPFGMGTSLMTFSPNGMSFNEYFDLDHDNLTVEAQIIRFLAGMSPKFLHKKYIVSPKDVDLFGGRLPSIHSGCYAASAALSSTVVKIVLRRGNVILAPRGYQVDFYRNTIKHTWRPFGNRNWIQRILIKSMHKMFSVQEFN
jgi:molybdopterin/thiamine biosynthesis adenylyltransferase